MEAEVYEGPSEAVKAPLRAIGSGPRSVQVAAGMASETVGEASRSVRALPPRDELAHGLIVEETVFGALAAGRMAVPAGGGAGDAEDEVAVRVHGGRNREGAIGQPGRAAAMLDVEGECGPRKGRPCLLLEMKQRNVRRLLGYGRYYKTPVAEFNVQTACSDISGY